MLIKTSELSGAALDWAVAEVLISLGEMTRDPNAIGITYIQGRYEFGPGVKTNRNNPDGSPFITHGCGSKFNPSSDWHHGGPLVDEFDVWLSSDDDTHCASTHPHVNEYIRSGPTKLIALCRAIVAAKFGDEVEVPDELLSPPL